MKFTIVWDERRSVEIEADSEEEARYKFYYNDFCYADANCNSSEIIEVYEFKE